MKFLFVWVGELLLTPDSFTLGAIALGYGARSLSLQSGLMASATPNELIRVWWILP
ncbi:MAG: hypothetical protein VKJ64_02620 [Leptolyngbyaceae bacterium]|nr:hypothetical protein [Leptolyngbyaceae bacterium]